MSLKFVFLHNWPEVIPQKRCDPFHILCHGVHDVIVTCCRGRWPGSLGKGGFCWFLFFCLMSPLVPYHPLWSPRYLAEILRDCTHPVILTLRGWILASICMMSLQQLLLWSLLSGDSFFLFSSLPHLFTGILLQGRLPLLHLYI